ncbi:MAG: glycosyltransferase [Nitrosomonadales bacterium]|nr:glycosyltransferase [Nitrosomonadales bacterium]
MKVLQVNVRLQEGGAARIALDLHRQLLNAGVESKFAYGWGEKGGRSSVEASVPNCFQVGQQIQVASNMMFHGVAGIDLVPPVGLGRQRLLDAICWADVVHLHVIHSYFLPFDWLLKELVRSGKPVVWTAHDYWMLTGRCAFTEGCEGWYKGCGCCPTQKNYPPSYLDFSAAQFKAKRQLLADLGKLLHVVTPSKFVAQAVREGLPDVNVSVIPNWIDSEFEAALRDVPLRDSPLNSTTEKIKVIVIANDLSDSTKVDRGLINMLSEMHHVEIHTIGQNTPFIGTNVVNHGRIAQRKSMVEKISAADVALFTSEKDTFGLVMIEALACGIPIFAVDSLASKEVLGRLGLMSMSRQEILKRLVNRKSFEQLTREQCSVSSPQLLSVYGAGAAIKAYLESYEDCIGSVVC